MDRVYKKYNFHTFSVGKFHEGIISDFSCSILSASMQYFGKFLKNSQEINKISHLLQPAISHLLPNKAFVLMIKMSNPVLLTMILTRFAGSILLSVNDEMNRSSSQAIKITNSFF